MGHPGSSCLGKMCTLYVKMQIGNGNTSIRILHLRIYFLLIYFFSSDCHVFLSHRRGIMLRKIQISVFKILKTRKLTEADDDKETTMTE